MPTFRVTSSAMFTVSFPNSSFTFSMVFSRIGNPLVFAISEVTNRPLIVSYSWINLIFIMFFVHSENAC